MNIPCKMIPLGGGSKLPGDFIPLSFMEFEGASSFTSDFIIKSDCGIFFDIYKGERKAVFSVLAGNYNNSGSYTYPFLDYSAKIGFTLNETFYPLRSGGYVSAQNQLTDKDAYLAINKRIRGNFNWMNNNMFHYDLGSEIISGILPRKLGTGTAPLSIGDSFTPGNANFFTGKLYRLAISQKCSIVRDFIPALTSEGTLCLFDETRNSAPLLNDTATFPIAGFTLAQARKLRHLPPGAGALTISLPYDWESDVAVNEALSIAGQNGWIITVRNYSPAVTTTTYSLRRTRTIVWCRKAISNHGDYVDTDGTRHRLEWCTAIYSPNGNEPAFYGYEAFDSKDAAVEAWQLSPYIPQENDLFE